ncbi:MAG: hypothetical protein SWX82_14605 [Cyanobacteriota bacterium]|nr:hypothetical protein [Cyanobacteriota bacterium]
MAGWRDGGMAGWGDGEIEKYLVMVEDGTFFTENCGLKPPLLRG